MESASFTLGFSLTTGITNKLLQITKNKNKKHHKIFVFAKNKSNCIETLISQVLIDLENIHEELITIFKERKCIRK